MMFTGIIRNFIDDTCEFWGKNLPIIKLKIKFYSDARKEDLLSKYWMVTQFRFHEIPKSRVLKLN